MKNCFFLFVFLLLISFVGQAQEITKVARQDSLIKFTVVRNGRYSSALYSMNDEPLTGSTLKSLLNKYPESATELRKFKAQKRLTFLMLPVFLAGVIIGGIQSDKQLDVAGSRFSKAPVPYSIGLAAFFSSIVIAATNDHYGKAIEAYNRRAKVAP